MVINENMLNILDIKFLFYINYNMINSSIIYLFSIFIEIILKYILLFNWIQECFNLYLLIKMTMIIIIVVNKMKYVMVVTFKS